jgi:PTS system fructose-specific IIC component/PTS system nitrogen regulatory IIA component
MFLRDVFLPEFIKVNLEAEDKDEVFEELVDHLCQARKLKIRDDILDALIKREAKMSTGVRKGIAIPHGNCDEVSELCGVLGISRKGIDYDALDGEPVYLLFTLVAPPKDNEKHLKILKRLSELLENPQFYIDLQSQRDAQSAHKVICKYEDMLAALN